MPFLNWLACCCGSSEGACCLDADTCVDDLSTTECHDQGGEHHPGDDCSAVDCSEFEPTGACCYGETCVAPEYEDACKDSGGDWIAEENCEDLGGGSTICTDALGACCWCAGCSEDIERGVCLDELDGTFSTANNCSLMDCESSGTTGPCCLPDCTCTMTLDSTACACLGGTFLSHPSASCSNCEVCEGACCIPNAVPGEPPTCTADQTPAQCEALGGTFRGNGSNCTACSGDSLNEGCADIMNVVPSGNYTCGNVECDTLNDADNKWPKAFVLQFEERAFFGERDNCNLNPCYETGATSPDSPLTTCHQFASGCYSSPIGYGPGNCCTESYPTWGDAGTMLRSEVFHLDKIRTVLLELDETESTLCEAVYYGDWVQDWDDTEGGHKTHPGLYKHGVTWPGGLHEIVRKQGGEPGALTRTTRATITTTATTDGTYFYRTAELLANINYLAGSVGFPAGDELHGGSIVGWRTPQDDEYKINTSVPCFCFSPDLLNTGTLEMFDPAGHVPDSDDSLSNPIGPDEPALPDALTTGIKRVYHGVIPGGAMGSDPASKTWCESSCSTESNSCGAAMCCHGVGECDNMTLAGCQSQGGSWYPESMCPEDPDDHAAECTDPWQTEETCCGVCGCGRCWEACDPDVGDMAECLADCKGACFDPSGSALPCPTGHDHIPRVHYSETYGPWLDQSSTYRHTVGYAVSYGIGSPSSPTCPAPDWMSICGWDSGGLWWPLTLSGHGLGGSDLLAQWVGYHCQAEGVGVIERRPKILRIDWSP